MTEAKHSAPTWQRIALGVMLVVAAYGIYNGILVIRERNSLVDKGERAVATIMDVSKGKCGMGYGYSATFTYEVNGSTLSGKCECESRAWVEPGDQYLVAYDPVQPEKVHLFADSLISATDSVQSP